MLDARKSGAVGVGSMPRQARLDTPGVVHHVMARGIEGREIFRDDRDRRCCGTLQGLIGSVCALPLFYPPPGRPSFLDFLDRCLLSSRPGNVDGTELRMLIPRHRLARYTVRSSRDLSLQIAGHDTSPSGVEDSSRNPLKRRSILPSVVRYWA